ncbi:hypothetical protein [Nitrospirillum iridis]|uniref:Glycosyltransferase RgtA/B/C/D-like domain-containing protein n=1 Tax=Nitrospirillum iridis TaxID=765888 RepID=A0A7X0B3S3_9PROT|nr:hypothetical protein [Nitrospirillum iridis]MBB6255198.1 hypothetical protein [Nitrospirillum iridis]
MDTLVLGVALVATMVPRLWVIGQPPAIDEGIYAYYAQLVHRGLSAGNGLPTEMPLMLYSVLGSWVFAVKANPFILLRLMDMAVAAVMAWLFCRAMRVESDSRLASAAIAGPILWVMNQPLFIDSGFRNPIVCASVPLLLAWMSVQSPPLSRQARRWALSGALVACAVLLREPFAPYALLGGVAALWTRRWLNFLAFTLGGGVATALVLGILALIRGGLAGLMKAYLDISVLYGDLGYFDWALFWDSGLRSAKVAFPIILMGLISLAAAVPIALGPGRARALPRLCFWLAVALIPLLEPMVKIGWPYHFASCLPGLGGVAAVTWRQARETGHWRKVPHPRLVVALALIAAVGWDARHPIWRSTPTLEAVASRDWPAGMVPTSNFLLMAQAIRAAAPSQGTLSVPWFLEALFPLTGLRAPTYQMANLNALVARAHNDKDRVRAMLAACTPDLLLISSVGTIGFPQWAILAEAVHDSGLFEPVVEIPAIPENANGNISGTLYRRISLQERTCDSL